MTEHCEAEEISSRGFCPGEEDLHLADLCWLEESLESAPSYCLELWERLPHTMPPLDALEAPTSAETEEATEAAEAAVSHTPPALESLPETGLPLVAMAAMGAALIVSGLRFLRSRARTEDEDGTSDSFSVDPRHTKRYGGGVRDLRPEGCNCPKINDYGDYWIWSGCPIHGARSLG